MAGKIIKFEEEAISEILIADTDSESGAEASDEDYFEEEEEEQQQQQQWQQQQQQQASAEVTITNNGQQNHQPSALPSVFFSWSKKGHGV